MLRFGDPEMQAPIIEISSGREKALVHHKCSMEQVDGAYRLPVQRCNRTYSSSTFLIVFAISLFVSGFMVNARMPAAFALSASTA